MKKIILVCCLIILSLKSFSQTCEERESNLLSAIGSFSAGFLYNTYGLIGSISDAFMKDAYNAETVSSLLNAQVTLADNFTKMLDDLMKEKAIVKKSDTEYINSTTAIIKGLKKQALLLADIAQTNSSKKRNLYEEQRKMNWAAISKLMGIDE